MAEETSLRDDLNAAIEQTEAPETPATETPAATETISPDSVSTQAETPEPAAETPPGERARDAQGRFAKKGETPADPLAPEQPTDAHAKPGTPPTQGATGQAPSSTALRAPGSWRPELRAHWGKVPAEVQAEIHRREQEINQGLRDAHQARAAVASMQQVLQPYMHNIQAGAGGDAIKAIGTLLQSDHVLRHGSQAERAQMVASIIKSYGVDVVTLDGILAGQPAHDDPQEALARRLRSEMQQQIAPITGYFQQLQQNEYARQQQSLAGAQSEVETFAQNAKYAHFDEVREEMADLMEVAARRGITMTLEQAYDRALTLDPRFAAERNQQAERTRVNAAAEAAQRAKRAAVSLPSGAAPTGSPGATAGNSLRADIEASMAAAEGR